MSALTDRIRAPLPDHLNPRDPIAAIAKYSAKKRCQSVLLDETLTSPAAAPAALLPGTLPKDFKVVPVSMEDLTSQSKKPRNLPGYLSLDARYVPSTLAAHESRMAAIVSRQPEAFTISETISIGKYVVGIGRLLRPKSVDGSDPYDTIPLYISEPGKQTQLVFAYRSKSQDCWRRFAGYLYDVYWKGPSEHLQNFDWRIQRKLDEVCDGVHPLQLRDTDGSPLDLADLSINRGHSNSSCAMTGSAIIAASEQILQHSMLEQVPPFDPHGYGVKPETLVDYWWCGKPEDPYGRHLTLLVASEKYLYCIGVTDEGLFLKFIQHRDISDINLAGAPAKGVLIEPHDSWILTPILEYRDYARGPQLGGVKNYVVRGTILGGGERVRINGVHDDAWSPLIEINNGLAVLPRMIRRADFVSANGELQKIRVDDGKLPLSKDPPERVPAAEIIHIIDRRETELLEAFRALLSGELDPSTLSGRTKMTEFHITSLEAAVLLRYRESLGPMANHLEARSDPSVNLFRKRLRLMAAQWAQDQVALAKEQKANSHDSGTVQQWKI